MIASNSNWPVATGQGPAAAVFDPAGRPVSGPPADADQSLEPYQLEIAGQSIFVVLEVT